jgi:Protein of unknown function (DUF3182)
MGSVVVYSPNEPRQPTHERETCLSLAARLANLRGYAFAGEYQPGNQYARPVYYVPYRTIIGIEAAKRLGIKGEDDLFGGVAPFAFVATKALAHSLVEPEAAAPPGWSHEFGRRVQGAVLRGFSAFTFEDAARAGSRLLMHGPVRVKPARATGGRGQTVVSDRVGLEAVLATTDADELSQHGLVIEMNLEQVATYSIGEIRVAGLAAAYFGRQRLTPDNSGAMVYGGSDLVILRGGFDSLFKLDLTEGIRLAVAQAREFDAAARGLFSDLIASRRNYDIAQGLDAKGRRRSGVLEQSWCIGGASGGEIAALEAFRTDPALRALRTSSVEVYGKCDVPKEASVLFCGTDEHVGDVTKFTLIEPYVDSRGPNRNRCR